MESEWMERGGFGTFEQMVKDGDPHARQRHLRGAGLRQAE
jgi:hypothetical protein